MDIPVLFVAAVFAEKHCLRDICLFTAGKKIMHVLTVTMPQATKVI
jgi:hypothetical protein